MTRAAAPSDPMASPNRNECPTLPKPVGGPVDVLVVAGEHSGDEQAARMVSALVGRHPHLRVAAIGGPRLRAVGAQLLLDLTALSVVGLVEVLEHFGYFRRVFAEVRRWVKEHRPRVVCFVDYPGFNLRLARALAADGITAKGGGPVRAVYYISPQIWAWKPRRRFAMAKTLDALAVIFPFEESCYADTGLPVRFVGHPFVSEGFVSPLVHAPSAPVLLLPGSRKAAVARIAPALLDGFAAFRKHRPDAVATMIYPSEEIRAQLEALLAERPALAEAVEPRPNDCPTAASAVLTSSGTMSLVCALAGIPGAIAYRANPFTYMLGRRLVTVPYLGIANLLLPEPMYPEFLQGAASPAVLAAELTDCLENPDRVARTQRLAEALQCVLRHPPRGDAADWLAEQLWRPR
jgi:lipid-A-disaccharide synthase